MAIFGLKRRAQLTFVHNVGNYEWFMQTEFGGTRSRDQNFTCRKWAFFTNSFKAIGSLLQSFKISSVSWIISLSPQISLAMSRSSTSFTLALNSKEILSTNHYTIQTNHSNHNLTKLSQPILHYSLLM